MCVRGKKKGAVTGALRGSLSPVFRSVAAGHSVASISFFIRERTPRDQE